MQDSRLLVHNIRTKVFSGSMYCECYGVILELFEVTLLIRIKLIKIVKTFFLFIWQNIICTEGGKQYQLKSHRPFISIPITHSLYKINLDQYLNLWEAVLRSILRVNLFIH